MAEPEPAIVVNPTSLPAQIATLVRYLITALGAYAIGKGWLEQDTLNFVLALSATVVPMAYGIYKAWTNNQKLKVLEPYLENSVTGRRKAFYVGGGCHQPIDFNFVGLGDIVVGPHRTTIVGR